MTITLGNNNSLNFKKGSAQVSKIYLGNSLVWEPSCLASPSLLLHLDNNFNDSSNNSSPTPASYQGGAQSAIISTSSVFGGFSAEFFGKSYINANNTNLFQFGTNDFTVECWINVKKFSTFPAIFGPNVSICGGFFCVLSNDYKILVGRQCFGWILQTPHTMTTNTWYHLAICRYNNILRIFQDGRMLGSTVDNNNYSNNSTSVACIGGALGAGNSLEGYMDEVRIVKNFAAYRNNNFTVPTSPLPSECVSLASPLPYGTFLYTQCVGVDYYGYYADGDGGEYSSLISACTCGSLDPNGNGFWNGHAYYLCNQQPTGWNGYHYYINDNETSLNDNGDGCWNSQNYDNGDIVSPSYAGYDSCTDTYWLLIENVITSTSLNNNGDGCWLGNYYINGVVTNLDCNGNGWNTSDNNYYLGGIVTDLDINGDGCWNSHNYDNGSIVNPPDGYDSCTNGYWINGFLTLLDSCGNGNHNTHYYIDGSQNSNGWSSCASLWYIDGTATMLDSSGSGYYNSFAYYNGSIQSTGWNGYYYYIDNVETTLNNNGDGYWNDEYYIGGTATPALINVGYTYNVMNLNYIGSIKNSIYGLYYDT